MAEALITEEQAKEREDKAARVAALREQLRNGRNAAVSGAGEDPGFNSGSSGADDGNSSNQSGPSFEAARREVEQSGRLHAGANRTVGTNQNRPGNDKRSAPGKSERVGQGDRRSVKSDSSPAPVAARTEPAHASIGNLFTEESSKPRKKEPEQPVAFFSEQEQEKPASLENYLLRYPKARAMIQANPSISGRQLAKNLKVSVPVGVSIKKEWDTLYGQPKPVKPAPEPIAFPLPQITSSKFTDREADDKLESLVEALESNFDYLDQYLWNREKRAAEARGSQDFNDQPVFSDMDDKELKKLAQIMLRGAKKSPAMATVVNVTIDSADYIAVGVAMGPRVHEFGKRYRAAGTPRVRRERR